MNEQQLRTRDPEYMEFLDLWHQIMIVSAIIAASITIAIFVYYRLKIRGIRDLKKRYDYVQTRETSFYWYMILTFGIGILLIANSLDDGIVGQSRWWFVIRFFIAGATATLFSYVLYLILKFYYPLKLRKKLDRLRYRPRISSAGNRMKLLSEEEEDVHLDEGMQAEEDVFSVDYDVWVDTATGEIKIEKYKGELEALQCGSCGFQTLRLVREEITKKATETEEGELLKHYECSYCKSVRTTQHNIAPVLSSIKDYKLPSSPHFKGERSVRSIMMEIVVDQGDVRDFYFQNIQEAKKFLEEFDIEKLPSN